MARPGPREARRAGDGPTLAELILAYMRHVLAYYVDPDGGPTSEVTCIKEALKPARQLYGHTPAADFGPLALKAIRRGMIDARLARTTINARVGRIRQMFKWAVAEELVESSVHHGLTAVVGLRAGRTEAREPDPILPVPDEHVEAVLPFLTPQIRAMVQVQALCGARPGEIVQMRTGDLDRSGPVWTFTPRRHKTQGRGKRRTIALGPRAQVILAPWLRADPEAFLFSPAEAMAALSVERRAARKSPMTPSQAARRPKAKPKRTPTDRYDAGAYRRAIARACVKAGVPTWHPHQLRHTVATRVRAAFGLESAQYVLGYAKASTTEIYAEANLEKAVQVMREVG